MERKETEKMSRGEILTELNRLNPFSGYAGGSKLSTDSLRETLRRFRGESSPASSGR